MRVRSQGRGSRRRWFFAALVALVILVQLPPLAGVRGALHEAVLPVVGLFGQVGRGIDVRLAQVGTSEDLVRENERLRQENAELARENARLGELERQNAFLLGTLGLKQEQPALSFIAADVIGLEPSSFAQSVTINRGREDDVRQGAVVMTPRGVVGQVMTATARSAMVLLLTDPRSGLDARTQGSEARGTVVGLGRLDLLLMRHVRQEEFLYHGERVVTSGRGGVFPAGLPVGTIAYVQRRDVDALQEGYLEPAADFTRLSQVLVLRSTSAAPVGATE